VLPSKQLFAPSPLQTTLYHAFVTKHTQ
jgi:hypothetical protein